MKFGITVDSRACLGYFQDFNEKQLPFAVSKALNVIANDAQAAERKHISSVFRIRRDWVLQGVYISPADRAKKSQWVVTIQIKGDRDFLDRFERGEIKAPMHGRWLWLPNVQVFGDAVIGKNNPLAPKNLRMAPDPTHGGQWRGANRTFMIHGSGNRGPLVLQRMSGSAKGISQRIGSGFMTKDSGRDVASGRFSKGKATKRQRRGGTRLLYTLISKVKMPVRLEFVNIITSTVNAEWEARLRESMTLAMATAK